MTTAIAPTILRLPDVLQRTGICRANVYAKMARGEFPRSVALGPRAVGWLDAEISAWINAQAAARQPAAA